MGAQRLEDGRVVFVAKRGDAGDAPITLACGQCRGCRLERSRTWAVRIMHEAQLAEKTSFITLTYSDEHLPEDGGLRKTDFQKFMKRLRKQHPPQSIKFFHCGEYGERYGRPHYHAALFGVDFKHDQLPVEERRGHLYYESETLTKLWPFGQHRIGNLTFESAAYIARYIMKKINGDLAEDHYAKEWDVDKNTGEVIVTASYEPEYTTMSRGGKNGPGGIGKDFYDKYKHVIYRDDFVISNGVKATPPKYYDRHYEIEQPRKMKLIKEKRQERGIKHVENNTPKRRRTREKLQAIRLKQLKRELD